MLSSEAGPVELITGRIGPVNLLPVVHNAERERVLLMVKSVMAVLGTTRQAAHIKMVVIL